MKYAIIAKDGQPSNTQVASHFKTVKDKHDEIMAAKKTAEAPAEATAEGSNSMESKMKSRVKIPSVDEIEETKGENSPRANPTKPAAQIPPMTAQP